MSNVCQDYGHGGGDPGAVALVKEKDGNLRYGQATTAALLRNGYAVRETRVADVAVSLSARVQISDGFGADWFISHHENAGGGHGIEVYCYKFGARGEKLARAVLNELCAATGLPSRGVKEGNFQVLRETDAPAILIEFGFVDNPQDVAVINNPAMPDIYADAVVKALCAIEGKAFVPRQVAAPQPTPEPVPQPSPVQPEQPKPVTVVQAPIETPATVVGDSSGANVEKNEPQFITMLKDPKFLPAILGILKLSTETMGIKIPDETYNNIANLFAMLLTLLGVVASWKK